jgi:hypothetical protein
MYVKQLEAREMKITQRNPQFISLHKKYDCMCENKTKTTGRISNKTNFKIMRSCTPKTTPSAHTYQPIS